MHVFLFLHSGWERWIKLHSGRWGSLNGKTLSVFFVFILRQAPLAVEQHNSASKLSIWTSWHVVTGFFGYIKWESVWAGVDWLVTVYVTSLISLKLCISNNCILKKMLCYTSCSVFVVLVYSYNLCMLVLTSPPPGAGLGNCWVLTGPFSCLDGVKKP